VVFLALVYPGVVVYPGAPFALRKFAIATSKPTISFNFAAADDCAGDHTCSQKDESHRASVARLKDVFRSLLRLVTSGRTLANVTLQRFL
jgi:hypothetical protein